MNSIKDNQNGMNMLLMKEIGTLYQKIRDLEAGMLVLTEGGNQLIEAVRAVNDKVSKLKSDQKDLSAALDNVFFRK